MQTTNNFKDLKGWDAVLKNCNEVRIRNKPFVFFEIDNLDPVVFKNVDEYSKDYQEFEDTSISSLKGTSAPPMESINSIWEEFEKVFKKQDSNKPIFGLIDFGYISPNGRYRSIFVLSSFIQEECSAKSKMIHATCVLQIKDQLSAPILIQATELSDINRDAIKKTAERIQITI